MSTYTEKFTGQTTGSNSTSTTDRYTSETTVTVENPAVGEEDSRVLQFVAGDTGLILQSLDAVDGDANRDNAEIVCRFMQTTDDDGEIYLYLRASGSSGSETCYTFHFAAGGTSQISRYDAGTPTSIATGSNLDLEGAFFEAYGDYGTYVPANLWHYVRFRVNGTGATVTLQAKYWSDGQSEPSGWDIDTTDTSGSRITTAGWCGVGPDAGQLTSTNKMYVDLVSIGTNGDTVTIPADTDGIVRTTTVAGEALYTTTTSPVRVTTVAAEALYTAFSPVRVTTVAAEALYTAFSPVRVTTVAAEVLYKVAEPQTYVETQWGSTDVTFPSSILTKRWTTTNETVLQCVSDATDGGPEDDYLLEQEWSVTARRLTSWDVLDSDPLRADTELLCRFRLENRSRQDAEFGLAIRAGGTAGSEDGYVCWTYEGGTDDIQLLIAEYNSGAGTTLVTTSDLYFNVDDEWLWLRFRVNGSDLKAKLWKDGQIEPTAWSVETTDSTITAAGWSGITGYAISTTTDIDYLSAATGGDTAPLNSSVNTVIRGTGASGNILGSQADPTTRVTGTSGSVLGSQADPTTRVTGVSASVLYSVQNQEIFFTQQVAELAVQQGVASIEARSTQQILEVLIIFGPAITQQIAEIAVQQNLTNIEVRNTQQIVEVLLNISLGISQQVAEVAVQQNLANIEVRSTHQVIELLLQADINYGLTQQIAEVAIQQNLASIEARSTQQVVEVLLELELSRVSQQIAEVAVYQNLANVEARSTQQVVEVLLESIPKGLLTQQIAELAVYQNLANVEVRNTQQVVEILTEAINYGRVGQQVAELTVQQDLANVEARSTQQVLEVLFFSGLEDFIIVTQSVAETAVQQNADHVDVRNTHQVVEVLLTVVALVGPAYDNYDAQPISIMA